MEVNEEETRLYDATLTLTFSATDIDEADAEVDELVSKLDHAGFEVGSVVVEESVQTIE